MPSPAVRAALDALKRRKFLCLLLLCILYPITLVLIPDDPWVLLPVDVVATAATVLILFATRHLRRLAEVAAILAVLNTVANVLSLVSPEFAVSLSFAIVRTCLLIGFFGAAIVVVLASVLDRAHVSMEKIFAGIAVYLMLGSLWGFLYILVVLLQPTAFKGATLISPTGPNGDYSWYDLELAEFTYFSYVTMSTLGYGDVTPSSVSAQMLVWIEALAGQVYLAVLIARLVSLQIIHSGLDAVERDTHRTDGAAAGRHAPAWRRRGYRLDRRRPRDGAQPPGAPAVPRAAAVRGSARRGRGSSS
jgi:voltage-gated potassium channel